MCLRICSPVNELWGYPRWFFWLCQKPWRYSWLEFISAPAGNECLYNIIHWTSANQFDSSLSDRWCHKTLLSTFTLSRLDYCSVLCNALLSSVPQYILDSCRLMLWAQSATNDYIRAEHKLPSISKLFISQVIIPQVTLLVFFFLAYLFSKGTQYGNLPPAGWRILLCGPTQEPCVSHSQCWKNQRGFGKNAGEWTGRVETSKEEIPGSKRTLYGYILTYARL